MRVLNFFAVFLGIGAVAINQPAEAQSSRSALTIVNNSYFKTNGVGAITGAQVNGWNQQVLASFGMVGDVNTWTALNTFRPGTLYFPGQVGYLWSNGSAPATWASSATGPVAANSVIGNNTSGVAGPYALTPAQLEQFVGAPLTFSAAAYGADPSYTNDNTAAFLAFWLDCNQVTNTSWPGGKQCYIPAGHYKFTQTVVLDTSLGPNVGINLYCGAAYGHGSPQGGTLLDFSSVPGAYLSISSSLNEQATNTTNTNFSNCGVLANNTNGPALQLGRHDLGDAINASQFANLWVANLGTGSATSAIQVNLVLESIFTNDTANLNCDWGVSGDYCAGWGSAWELRSSSFNLWNSGSGGHAKNAFYLTAGYNYGNTIQAFDCEVAFNCITIDSNGSGFNTWHNGQFQWGDAANNGVALTINSNSPYGPVSVLGAVTGGSGYTNGTYGSTSAPVLLTGGSGSGAYASQIVVSGGQVTSVTFYAGGAGFQVGDVLSTKASRIGGTGSGFSVPVTAIYSHCPANESNIIDNGNLTYAGTKAVLAGTCKGAARFRGALPPVSTPTFPASGAVLANTTGRQVSVQMYGGTISAVCVDVGAPSCMSNSTPGIPWTVTLRPQDSIKVVYTGSPGWLWYNAD